MENYLLKLVLNLALPVLPLQLQEEHNLVISMKGCVFILHEIKVIL